MSRYTGPKWRINRRENSNVLGTGEKWKRRQSAPGDFPLPKKKVSEYGIQFREKQRVKRTYGMNETQFRRFFSLARKATGNTGTRFLQLLEMRADSIVFNLGLARTRRHARQLVSHGLVLVNGKRHDVPSTVLNPGDEIKIKDSILKTDAYQQMLQELKDAKTPTWLERFSDGGKVTALPTRDLLDQSIKERLIIELYSKA